MKDHWPSPLVESLYTDSNISPLSKSRDGIRVGTVASRIIFLQNLSVPSSKGPQAEAAKRREASHTGYGRRSSPRFAQPALRAQQPYDESFIDNRHSFIGLHSSRSSVTQEHARADRANYRDPNVDFHSKFKLADLRYTNVHHEEANRCCFTSGRSHQDSPACSYQEKNELKGSMSVMNMNQLSGESVRSRVNCGMVITQCGECENTTPIIEALSKEERSDFHQSHQQSTRYENSAFQESRFISDVNSIQKPEDGRRHKTSRPTVQRRTVEKLQRDNHISTTLDQSASHNQAPVSSSDPQDVECHSSILSTNHLPISRDSKKAHHSMKTEETASMEVHHSEYGSSEDTTSTTRRHSVKTLFKDHGIRRPAGLISPPNEPASPDFEHDFRNERPLSLDYHDKGTNCDSPGCQATHIGHRPYRHSISCSKGDGRVTEAKIVHDSPATESSSSFHPESIPDYVECHGYPRTGHALQNQGSPASTGIVGECQHCLNDCQCQACQNTNHNVRCCTHKDHVAIIHHHHHTLQAHPALSKREASPFTFTSMSPKPSPVKQQRTMSTPQCIMLAPCPKDEWHRPRNRENQTRRKDTLSEELDRQPRNDTTIRSKNDHTLDDMRSTYGGNVQTAWNDTPRQATIPQWLNDAVVTGIEKPSYQIKYRYQDLESQHDQIATRKQKVADLRQIFELPPVIHGSKKSLLLDTLQPPTQTGQPLLNRSQHSSAKNIDSASQTNRNPSLVDPSCRNGLTTIIPRSSRHSSTQMSHDSTVIQDCLGTNCADSLLSSQNGYSKELHSHRQDNSRQSVLRSSTSPHSLISPRLRSQSTDPSHHKETLEHDTVRVKSQTDLQLSQHSPDSKSGLSTHNISLSPERRSSTKIPDLESKRKREKDVSTGLSSVRVKVREQVYDYVWVKMTDEEIARLLLKKKQKSLQVDEGKQTKLESETGELGGIFFKGLSIIIHLDGKQDLIIKANLGREM